MSSFSYHLSVPIDDARRVAQLEKMALGHNRAGKLAPAVRDFLYDLLDGKYVRIATDTDGPARKQRRLA